MYNVFHIFEGVLGLNIIVIGNGHNILSSIPGQDYL